MERQDQKKNWSELTEEEREVIRESWKHTLPENFDVFCIGDWDFTEELDIPGNLYVSGTLDEEDTFLNVSVLDDLIVDGCIQAGEVNVGGNFIVGHVFSVDSLSVGGDCIVEYGFDSGDGDVIVDGDFIVGKDIWTGDVSVIKNFIVSGKVDSLAINVKGLFDCNDVNSNDKEIRATDFICRCYETVK